MRFNLPSPSYLLRAGLAAVGLGCVVLLLVVTFSNSTESTAKVGGLSIDGEKTPAPTESDTEAPYPPPVTPGTPGPWFIPDVTPTPDPTALAMTDEAFAQNWLSRFEDWVLSDPRGPAMYTPPFKVIEMRQVLPGQMAEALVPSYRLERTSVPDLAIILGGSFRIYGPESAYCLFVIDRSSGYILTKKPSNDLGELQALLP